VKEIEAHGFTVERITGLMGPLAWTTQFRLLGYREVLRRIPLLGAVVLPFLVALMNVGWSSKMPSRPRRYARPTRASM